MQTYDILIRGLELEVRIGVTREERSAARQLRFDVALTVQGGAPESDRIQETVDYSEVARVVADCAGEAEYLTLEKLAGLCCERLLATFRKIVAVDITVEKPNPPMEPKVAACAVHLMKKRDNRSNYL